jgi:pimeloyl-ACP methyl ester carboxylesterase
MHPRLFHSLVLLDPVVQQQSTQAPVTGERFVPLNTILSTHRRDIWPSRQAAAESFKRNPFYQTWDPRVLDQWIKYGLRELPTLIHPLDQTKTKPNDISSTPNDRPVTLTTTRHQEVFTFSRPNYDFDPTTNRPANPVTHPDLDPDGPNAYPFYRPEPIRLFSQLPHLRPSVLYIFGGKSDMSLPKLIKAKLETTGTGAGGSGGVAAGRVRSVLFEEYGHLLAQEAVTECAEAAAEFLGPELQRWKKEDEAFRAQWSKKSQLEKVTVDERWKAEVGPPPARGPRNNNNNNHHHNGNSKSKL